LDQPKDINSMFDYLGTQFDAIHELPEEQRLDLSILMQELIRRDAFVSKGLSESAAAARTWVLSGQASRSQAMLAKVKKAKRLEELVIQHWQVDEFFRKNLSSVIHDDPRTAAKVILLLSDLAREAQRRGEWHMYFGNGNSTEGFMLRHAIYSTEIKDWRVYNFVVDTLRNDEGRGVEAASAGPHAAGNAVNAALERARKLAGRRPMPINEQVRAMYEECGAGLSGRPSSLFIRGFYERVNGQLDEKSCEKIRTWSRVEAANGKYPELAADLDATVALIATQKGAAGRKKFSPGERRPLADYHGRFLAVITDAKLPLTWRVFLADFLAHKERGTLPLEVARAMVKLHSEAIAAGVPVVDGEQTQLTFVAETLIGEPGSADLLKDWREQWAARYLRGGPRRSFQHLEYENLNSLSSSDALCRALAIYYRAGDTDRAGQVLRKYDFIGKLPLAAAVLVRAKQPAETAKLIRGNWTALEIDWPNEAATQYDADLAAILPAVYDEFERDDQRYFAQLLFASMPDAESLGDLPSRDDRMRQLSGKLDQVVFSDNGLRRRTLVLLSRSAATRDDVAELVAEEFDSERVAAAFQADDSQDPRIIQETQLAVCHLRNRLDAGDAAAMANLLKRLNASPSEDDYEFGQRVSPLVDCCRDELREPGKVWLVDDCKAIATELQKAISSREYVYFPDYRGFNSLMTALICQADDLAAAEKWLKSLSNDIDQQMVNQGVTDDVWKFAVRLNGAPTAENRDARMRYVRNVLRYACDRKWGRWDPQHSYHLRGEDDDACFESIVKSKLLSAEELKEHGGELVKSVNDVRFVTAAWAAWLESAKEHDLAATAWQQVVDAEPNPKENEPKLDDRYVHHVLSLARCMSKGGNGDVAKAALATLEGKEVPEPMREPLEKLRRELSEGTSVKSDNKAGKNDDPKNEAAEADAEETTRMHAVPVIPMSVLLLQSPTRV
jgi:hypothetical protein